MVTKPHLIIFLSVTNAPTDIEGSSSTTTTTTTVEPPIEAELGRGEVPEVEGRLSHHNDVPMMLSNVPMVRV
jgi:hypothetical protein